jgi:outer membrane protein TolC
LDAESDLFATFYVARQRAVSNQAATAYDQAIANYRQTVLIGFQQVEDNKAGIACP